MPIVSRVLVVGWMVAGLLACVVATMIPALAAYGVARWWAGPEASLMWLETLLNWVARVGILVALWFVARHAARVGGPLAPSHNVIVVAAMGGLALGMLGGIRARDAWGVQILAAVGLPDESLLDDFVTAGVLAGYALAVLVATYVPRRHSGAV